MKPLKYYRGMRLGVSSPDSSPWTGKRTKELFDTMAKNGRTEVRLPRADLVRFTKHLADIGELPKPSTLSLENHLLVKELEELA